MDLKVYQVKCLICNGSSIVQIDNQDRVYWVDTDKVISARKRLDNQWGWQCACGNNDIMTKQEHQQIMNPQSPSSKDIEEIVKNIKPDKPKFEMVMK